MESVRVVVGVVGRGVVPGAAAGARLRTSEDAGPEIAASLIGCVESKRSQTIAILTTSLTPSTLPPSHCRRITTLHSTISPAIMSDNENGDELVTKPFKFVTGKLRRHPNRL